MLLTEFFPAKDGYSVAPVAQPLGESQSIDFTVEYIVERNAKPIMFLEIKPPSTFGKRSARKEADVQMRKRFGQLFDDCPDFINELYGLSAFGTKIAYYKLDFRQGTITPPKIPDDITYLIDTAPCHWWENDIMHPNGVKKFLDIVSNIKRNFGNAPF